MLVLGLGVSGRSAARFCASRGARVVAADAREADAFGDLSDLSELSDVELVLGEPQPDPADFDLVVPSPGVPRERYAERAKRVCGDIELAWQALEIPIVAVTGTNGKSTTVSLVEAMLRAAGLRTRAAGNLGTPALSLVGEPLDAAVLELSSFQLETTEGFAPKVAVVLNVAPDHLDRHGSFEAYVAAKRRILELQSESDFAVLNWEDPVVRGMASATAARIVPFQRTPGPRPEPPCAWLDLDVVVLETPDGPLRLSLEGMSLAGSHNRENALAALTAVWAAGADPERACEALVDFQGLPHRCEVVGTIRGVMYVDDSKATNTSAAQSALEGFEQPVVWIAGGRDKGLAFDELAEVAGKRVRVALLIGEAAPAIERALAARVPVERPESLGAAVRRAAECAEPGDVVLLAPACSSFDQFASYEERGEHFRSAVEALAEGGAAS